MTRHAPHTYLLAALYDLWNLATEPLRVRVARWDEERASALGGGDDPESWFVEPRQCPKCEVRR